MPQILLAAESDATFKWDAFAFVANIAMKKAVNGLGLVGITYRSQSHAVGLRLLGDHIIGQQGEVVRPRQARPMVEVKSALREIPFLAAEIEEATRSSSMDRDEDERGGTGHSDKEPWWMEPTLQTRHSRARHLYAMKLARLNLCSEH
ncbi:hypothetical protein BDN67DRAFT_1003876 [Paxillus ammoniavirescens]|nr:hypothetical protein BDN67DRAFT_1003876 [Paxillus ammoniavirescens]